MCVKEVINKSLVIVESVINLCINTDDTDDARVEGVEGAAG